MAAHKGLDMLCQGTVTCFDRVDFCFAQNVAVRTHVGSRVQAAACLENRLCHVMQVLTSGADYMSQHGLPEGAATGGRPESLGHATKLLQ